MDKIAEDSTRSKPGSASSNIRFGAWLTLQCYEPRLRHKLLAGPGRISHFVILSQSRNAAKDGLWCEWDMALTHCADAVAGDAIDGADDPLDRSQEPDIGPSRSEHRRVRLSTIPDAVRMRTTSTAASHVYDA